MSSGKKQRITLANKNHQSIDHARSIEMLTDAFPEIPQAFDDYGKGLLHCEMGVFARLTEEAMEAGRFWQAEKYFRFVERVRIKATPEVQNAIDISYIEYLAFGEVTANQYQGMKRMPPGLRVILLEIDGRGRWA